MLQPEPVVTMATAILVDVGDDDRYDDDDDCSVLEAASRISPEQDPEDTSGDNYGPYWDNSPTRHHT